MNKSMSAALLLAPARRRAGPHLYYFVWLTAAVNTLVGGGYLLVSPLGHFGDWHAFIRGLPSPTLWRLGLTALGFALSYAGLVVASRAVDPLAGAEEDRIRRLRLLCWTPYFSGAAVSLFAALRDPGGLDREVPALGGTPREVARRDPQAVEGWLRMQEASGVPGDAPQAFLDLDPVREELGLETVREQMAPAAEAVHLGR